MIYEYRAYTVAPGKMNDLFNRFRNHAIPLFERHGIKPIAFFTPVIAEASNQLIFILEFKDLAHRESAWAGFMADEDWKKAFVESHKDGELVISVENKILAPTDFSPLG